MKIGMAGAAMMMSSWLDGMKAAGELGYDAYELFGEYPQVDADKITKKDREKGRKLSEKLKLEIALHAPFNSLNIAAFNEGIRKESVRQSIEAVKLCADLGGHTVIIHNGDLLLDPILGEVERTAVGIQWDLNIDSLKRVAEVAEKLGVMLCLENCNFVYEKVEKSLQDLVAIRKEVGSKNLKFNLDIGHARLAEGVDTAIKVLGKDIRHMHFTDNFGTKDDHVVIGEGNFDYSSFIDFVRKFKYIVTLEAIVLDSSIEPARKSLANFRKIMSRG